MKSKVIISTLALISGIFIAAPTAQANEFPVVESLTITPNTIELTSGNTTVNFEVVVSHPFGISQSARLLTINDGVSSSYNTLLRRSESPENMSLKKVVFKGSITIPTNANPGAYFVSVPEFTNNSTAGYTYSTGEVIPKEINTIYGAENALLVRSAGFLNYAVDTFNGPSYDSANQLTYVNTAKYNISNKPILRVGETLKMSDYFESYVTSLPLKVSTQSPAVCSVEGDSLKFIAQGGCIYTVFTEKTNDYAGFSRQQSVNVSSARVKPILSPMKVADQTDVGLPKSVDIGMMYGPSGGWMIPQSTTPEVCVVIGFTARLINSGTCKILYQTIADNDYAASDPTYQTFIVGKASQTLIFEVPSTAKVGSKGLTLNATASSAGAVTYSATPSNVCSVTGTTLNFKGKGICQVTASQAGTTTISPVSITKSITVSPALLAKKTITCVKGSKKIKTTAAKCPKGYKKR